MFILQRLCALQGTLNQDNLAGLLTRLHGLSTEIVDDGTSTSTDRQVEFDTALQSMSMSAHQGDSSITHILPYGTQFHFHEALFHRGELQSVPEEHF